MECCHPEDVEFSLCPFDDRYHHVVKGQVHCNRCYAQGVIRTWLQSWGINDDE